MTRYTPPLPTYVYRDPVTTALLKYQDEMLETIRRGNSLMREINAFNDELLKSVQVWRRIAVFNIAAQGYEDVEDHLEKCYDEEGNYHGGNP